ncbi:lytic transglycosylase domain-containing protein [Paenibacillus chartarius]|uniref:Lytic transglycosylase domain-containing protein n=1 Tax=Paenibacillus chartarius TaxID=747481 RepID=A0ABV6DUH8_9BACL
MNVNATTLKQLLQLQLLNTMELITSGQHAAAASSDDDFAGLLQTMLEQTGGSGAEASSADGNPLASLAALGGGAMNTLAGFGAGGLAAGTLPAAYRSAAAYTAYNKQALRSEAGNSTGGGHSSGYDDLIAYNGSRFGVDTSLIKAVIHQESSYNPNAVSHAGAKGLMQLMDGTGAGLGVTDPFDPGQNVRAGTQFLSGLLRKYNGNEGVALAAYNAGPGRVDRLGIRTDADLAAKLGQLPKETQNYVQRVLSLKDQYTAASMS